MSTARDLITASLRLIGAVSSGEAIAASEASDGLGTLNRMLSSWSTESLTIFAPVRETFPLTGSDGQYTIGATADFNTTRPVQIKQAFLIDQTSSPSVEYPVEILSLSQWQDITLKDLNGLPAYLYIDGAFPTATIYLYPRPQSSSYTLGLWSEKELSPLALDTTILLPPGYEEAIVYNLAARLAPEYGKALAPEIVAFATESKANIKRANHRPSYLRCDSELTGMGGGSFNMRSGGFGR